MSTSGQDLRETLAHQSGYLPHAPAQSITIGAIPPQPTSSAPAIAGDLSADMAGRGVLIRGIDGDCQVPGSPPNLIGLPNADGCSDLLERSFRDRTSL